MLNLENFHFEPEWIAPWEKLYEGRYVENIFSYLQNVMGGSFSDYYFVYYASNGIKNPPQPIVVTDPRPKILIWSGDQRAETPLYMTRYFKAIFKTHLEGDRDKPDYYHLPLGYAKDVKIDSLKPFAEREVNVFYSGNFNTNRIDLVKSLAGISFLPNKMVRYLYKKKFRKLVPNNFSGRFPSSYISFTEGFAKGLDGAEYSELLNNSKIVLCPPGFHRNETFRHYEALRAGAIPISLPLPDNHFYRGAPFVIINQWNELEKTVKHLLSNPVLLEDLHRQSVNWWENVCSEKAVAEYMAKIISR
jgi:hypothetical protein